ncbi:hypothetical protein [Hydrogenimonas thermophila]|uniref:hypothetical protein n=1 Tax=Hydrogenimonas thermophila TaxID=223786 RepID=UPI00116033A6|nr:hypothetical protein [Hydrogenimonas thermophila]
MGSLLLSGCGPKTYVNNLHKDYVGVTVSESKTLYFGNAGIAGKAAYKLAEICKQNGYNYMLITNPINSNKKMYSSAEELKGCLESKVFSMCPESRIRIRFSDAVYTIWGKFYKEQPVNIITIPCDKVLVEFKEYVE